MVDVSPHFDVNVYPKDPRDVVFSGPDGIADHRTHTPKDKRVIGNYRPTSFLTSDTDYLWRANPQGTPVHLRSKSEVPGEIGWHSLEYMRFPFWTGHQKLMSEFWRQAEDNYTHRYQDAWYPATEQDLPYNPEPKYFYYTKYLPKPTPEWCYRHARDSPASHAGIKPSLQHQEQPGYWRRSPAATEHTDYNADTTGNPASAAQDNPSALGEDEATVHNRSQNASRCSGRLLNSRQNSAEARQQQLLMQNRSHSANVYTTFVRLPSQSSLSARGSTSY